MRESKVSLPFFVDIVSKHKGFVLVVDRNDMVSERVVDALKRHSIVEIKDHSAPSAVVVKQRRTKVTVNRLLVDFPDAVEGRLGLAAAVDVPILSIAVGVHSHQP